jgi:hypothetical protein
LGKRKFAETFGKVFLPTKTILGYEQVAQLLQAIYAAPCGWNLPLFE